MGLQPWMPRGRKSHSRRTKGEPGAAAGGIVGIGIDLVENARIAASIEKHGDRFLQRVFCESELAYCRGMRNPVPHYAVRFAAKEAVAKAFGCGIGRDLGFLDMEITRDGSGAPGVLLHGPGASLAVRHGVTRILLSLTHTDEYSAANAMLLAGRCCSAAV